MQKKKLPLKTEARKKITKPRQWGGGKTPEKWGKLLRRIPAKRGYQEEVFRVKNIA